MPAFSPLARAEALADLRRSTRLWRAGELARVNALSTGFPTLDQVLPGQGWPVGAVTEILSDRLGLGELSLVVPVVRQLCDAHRAVVFIRPPCVPYAPALERAGIPLTQLLWLAPQTEREGQWAAEQLLREGKTGAVLLWSEARDDRPTRRLQLCAEAGQSLAFLYRPLPVREHRSSAALRLALHPAEQGVAVELFKVRGGRPCTLSLSLRWPI